MERTGHRSVEGIGSYNRTSTAQQQDVSDILSNSKRSHSTEVVPLHPSRRFFLLQPTQISTSTNNVYIPNNHISPCDDHSGALYLNSCSNVTLTSPMSCLEPSTCVKLSSSLELKVHHCINFQVQHNNNVLLAVTVFYYLKPPNIEI